MIKTFFKIALRNFIKEKFFSTINVVGLSVGIAVTLLITLYLVHELTFDSFHSKAERIHRIGVYLEAAGSGSDINGTFPPMAVAMKEEIPGIENAVRLTIHNGRIFKREDEVFTEDKVMYADSAFFGMFDFELLAGNPRTALSKPYQVVLTPALVQKYFDTEDLDVILGQNISINQELYEVSGVVAEAPSNSHLQFTAIASLESIPSGRDKTWNNINLTAYVLLESNTAIQSVMEKTPAMLRKYMPGLDEFAKQGLIMRPISHPLLDIHLESKVRGDFEPGGSMSNIYIFGSVALVVLLLASVNFVNLLTARSANRAKEVGVRKVLGSSRGHLMRQFILECILLVSVSTLLALGVVELLRGPFTALIGKSLPFDLLLTPSSLTILMAFIVILGVLAGCYPAFFLSSFLPAEVLKGRVRSGFRGGRLRNILVTVQFMISMVLITCTLVMQKQLEFMRSKNLGFDRENVVVIDNAGRLKSQQAYIDAIKGLAGVESAGAATFRPVDDYDGMLVTVEEGKDDRKPINYSRVDQDYLAVVKYTFLEGRNFSRDIASDSAAVVINEQAAKLLYGGNALGKKLYNEYEYTVIGVVKDFNFESLKNEIRPLVFFPHGNQRFLHVRLRPGDHQLMVQQLESIWKAQTSEIPFHYAFLDDTYDNLFKEDVKLGTIFSVFTGLGLFIACLGLMGITAYMAEQRRKEISIRKVLGAEFFQVMSLLSKEFFKIMIIAFAIALPLSWYIMNQWLDTFVYRTTVPMELMVVGGIAVILTAFAAVSYQSVRAALVDPVDSLKEE